MTSDPNPTPRAKREAISADERVSLHGRDPEDVLRALLEVDPDSPTTEELGKDQGTSNKGAKGRKRPKP